MKNKLEVSFYHLTKLSLLKAGPKLIEKIYYSKQRLLVLLENGELLKSLDELLWSYSTKHFIAHGTLQDPHPEDQPILLGLDAENKNNATIAMAMGKVDLDSLHLNRYLYMFEGESPEQLEFARNKWKFYQAKGSEITYWKQDDSGNWEKK